YYSLLDWHHPDYTVDCCHPMRDNQEERAKNQDRDMRRYVDYVGEQNQTWRYTGYTCPSLRQAVQGISL
ncbi:MAG: alpha-L-fucosidase, partial [Phycisphaerales bacterium]|nr:alpha-L-fucosidase [Phycisphaerales bacterium]